MGQQSNYTVRFLPKAYDNMDEIILAFIRLGSRQGAERIKGKFLKAVDQVRTFPYSAPVIRDPKLAGLGFRTIVVEKYIMLYRVIEEAKEIVFYNIFNGKEDYPSLLRSMYFK